MLPGPNFGVTITTKSRELGSFGSFCGVVRTRTYPPERPSRPVVSFTSVGDRMLGSGTRHRRARGSHSSRVQVGYEICVKPKNSLDVPPNDLRRSQTRICGGALKLKAKRLVKPP